MDHLTHTEWEFDVKEVIKDLDLVMFEAHEQSWYADINREGAVRGEGGNKLRTYNKFKNEFIVEAYVKKIMPFQYRSALAKFRCGTAPIRVETGRYGSNRLPVNERVCFNCINQVEDEYHVLMECPLYDDLREDLMRTANSLLTDFDAQNSYEQFSTLLSNEIVIYYTAKTLCYILKRHQTLYSR